MKTFLALLIAYSASQVAYDRVYQRQSLVHPSPQIQMCQFKPVTMYGNMLKFKGYFETGKCCHILDKGC